MSIQACAELVEKADPDRFLSAMTAPPEAREKLFALYAFNAEIARAPWASNEPMIAEMRLQFWRDTLADIEAGKSVRGHEAAAPLAQVVRDGGLSIAHLDEMVLARRWDIYRDPFEDESEFARHLDHTAGHLMWAAAKALGAAQTAEGRVRQIAAASGLANWLVAVPQLEARGRIPLVDGRAQTLRALAQGALASLAQVRPAGLKPAAPALRAAWLAKPILQQVVSQPERVAQGALGVSEFSRKGRLLWASLRGGW